MRMRLLQKLFARIRCHFLRLSEEQGCPLNYGIESKSLQPAQL